MDRLLDEVEVVSVHGDLATEITSIAFDSRAVQPGALFCCIPGARHDGHDHAAEAVGRGAVGLLAERQLPVDVPQAVVAPGRVRAALARVSGTFFSHPSRALVTVGVTGTNGKTTVTHVLAAIFEEHGWPTTIIGTLDGARTTPEAPVLQRRLAEARDGGQRAVCMEVSSHALAQHRVDDVAFAATVFTNLSHDHLDYHGSIEAYFAAKSSLFTSERTAVAVVNRDDEHGRRLLELSGLRTVGYSLAETSEVESTAQSTSFTWRGRRVELALAGAFQVSNALAAATTAVTLGVPEDVVVSGLRRAGSVPGRFQVVSTSAPVTVVVDYAHTPDGLAVALASARRLAGTSRVLCVFGCGGERDRAKRPRMGAIAASGADVAVVTSDNPRSEDPDAIIADVLAGIPTGSEVLVRPDRGDAIELAVGLACPGDVVLVAGKGHEDVIEIGAQRLPFDDRDVAARALARRFGAQAVEEPR
jgi:UDP-N-acetylmuramoyl-L-alanyl-D-glutamate--2,6-diaminopimelate ligase